MEAAVSRTCLVRKTNLPDVYEILDFKHTPEKSSFVAAGGMRREFACIPKLETSRYLATLFRGLGFSETLKMQCSWHPAFQKWVPQECIAD